MLNPIFGMVFAVAFVGVNVFSAMEILTTGHTGYHLLALSLLVVIAILIPTAIFRRRKNIMRDPDPAEKEIKQPWEYRRTDVDPLRVALWVGVFSMAVFAGITLYVNSPVGSLRAMFQADPSSPPENAQMNRDIQGAHLNPLLTMTASAPSGQLAVSSVNGVGAEEQFRNPAGVAIDGGNLYVADSKNNKIRKIVIATGELVTLAGSGAKGYEDGVGAAATFNYPMGISTDGKNLYVADTNNNGIRKIMIATGVVTTLAGSGANGYSDGKGAATSFDYPMGIATDGSNLYVADSGNNRIRKIVIATGEVTTLAGSGTQNSEDGMGRAASFNSPRSLTEVGGNLYVADTGNNKIRRIGIVSGAVSTLAGSGIQGSTDASGLAASFRMPSGIATDGDNLYVTDTNNQTIRMLEIATGAVTTLAGSGTTGSLDATGKGASFNYPMGIAIDDGNLYVADNRNNKIREIEISTGVATSLAVSETARMAVFEDSGTTASFSNPTGIATDGSNLYVADNYNRTIRKIAKATGAVTTLNGMDGTTGKAASFSGPYGIATDGKNLYVADTENYTIRKVVISTGVVTTLAGSGNSGFNDGTGVKASFGLIFGITTDGSNLYAVDADYNTIRKIVIATGVVTTLAGKANVVGALDGTGAAASFDDSLGITTDGSNLYVADSHNNKIRKIVIETGLVTTLAGSGVKGSNDGTGTAATFFFPRSLVTSEGNLYVTDAGNNKIRKIVMSTGEVSTLAGSAHQGSLDGTGIGAEFHDPYGITTDGSDLYIADSANNKIRKIMISTGVVTTLAGSKNQGTNDSSVRTKP